MRFNDRVERLVRSQLWQSTAAVFESSRRDFVAVDLRDGTPPVVVDADAAAFLEAKLRGGEVASAVGEHGPRAAWRWDPGNGWWPLWSLAVRAGGHCPRGCRCERHDARGVRWATRREFLDAHADVAAGAERWEYEVDAGLRHDDEVRHDVAPSPGKTGCRYCALLRTFNAADAAGDRRP